MDVMTYLQPKEQDEYAALKQLFEAPGWKILQQKLEGAEKYQAQACAHAEDMKQLYRGQGRLLFLREMLNYENSIEEGVQALAAERQFEAELDAETVHE